jgi:sugar phosphate isomerase/epimerase
MKLGLFTAAFPDRSLESVADWASAHGYQALELACWPRSPGDRRYSGVTTLDVVGFDRTAALRVKETLRSRNLVLSSLGYYANPLHPDEAVRQTAAAHIKALIDAASLLELQAVGTFVGKDKSKTVDANWEQFAKVWPPLVRYAKERGVKIAIENCPMLFSGDEWPGGTNLATTPAIWKRMWEIVPDDNFGLNLDPSHLVWQMIDIERVVREFSSRIFHVHAKDLLIDREGLYQHGILSAGMGWQVPRLPGLGDIDWPKFLSALYRAGYDGVVSVEHEDRNFEGTVEKVERGFLIARDTLAPYLH